MAIRPGRTVSPLRRAWTRTTKRVASKAYVKGVPDPRIHQYEMGTKRGDYDLEVTLVMGEACQVRDNALEAARIAANKVFERDILPENYFLKVLLYPHQCLREHSALTGAGADRLSDGMRLSFGKPTGRAAVVSAGQTLMVSRTYKKFEEKAREAFTRALKKMPGAARIEVKPLAAS